MCYDEIGRAGSHSNFNDHDCLGTASQVTPQWRPGYATAIITIPGYFEVKILAGNPSGWRWNPMLPCHVGMERRPRVPFLHLRWTVLRWMEVILGLFPMKRGFCLKRANRTSLLCQSTL